MILICRHGGPGLVAGRIGYPGLSKTLGTVVTCITVAASSTELIGIVAGYGDRIVHTELMATLDDLGFAEVDQRGAHVIAHVIFCRRFSGEVRHLLESHD